MKKIKMFGLIAVVSYFTASVAFSGDTPITVTFPKMHSPAHVKMIDPKLVLKFSGGDGGVLDITGNQGVFSPNAKPPKKVCGYWKMTLSNSKTGKTFPWSSPQKCLPIKTGQRTVP